MSLCCRLSHSVDTPLPGLSEHCLFLPDQSRKIALPSPTNTVAEESSSFLLSPAKTMWECVVFFSCLEKGGYCQKSFSVVRPSFSGPLNRLFFGLCLLVVSVGSSVAPYPGHIGVTKKQGIQVHVAPQVQSIFFFPPFSLFLCSFDVSGSTFLVINRKT